VAGVGPGVYTVQFRCKSHPVWYDTDRDYATHDEAVNACTREHYARRTPCRVLDAEERQCFRIPLVDPPDRPKSNAPRKCCG